LLLFVQGAGTKDNTLIRVVVSRCEVDMVQIKQEVQRQFGKSLDALIEVFLYFTLIDSPLVARDL
jgi:Annexin